MSRLKHLLKPSTLVRIYNSLVLPRLYFSILCWGFEYERLVKLQRRAMRIIHQAKYNAPHPPTRISAELYRLPVNKSCTNSRIRHYFHSLFNSLPIEVKNRFDTHSIAVFSHGYKLSLLKKYSSEYCIGNCYICGPTAMRN